MVYYSASVRVAARRIQSRSASKATVARAAGGGFSSALDAAVGNAHLVQVREAGGNAGEQDGAVHRSRVRQFEIATRKRFI